MELYSPAFGAAASWTDVHGNPGTQGTSGYMCAYNRINGDWAWCDPVLHSARDLPRAQL